MFETIIRDGKKQYASLLTNQLEHRFRTVYDVMMESASLIEELRVAIKKNHCSKEICDKLLNRLVLVTLLMDYQIYLDKIGEFQIHSSFKKQIRRCFDNAYVLSENASISHYQLYVKNLFGCFFYANYFLEDYMEQESIH